MTDGPPVPASREQLARLCRDYRAALKRFFERRGCSAALADDLTQDAFVRIAAYPSFDRIANPSAFLYRTAANLLRDTAKAARRRPTASIDAPGIAAHRLVDPITPDRLLEGRQDVAIVVQAFGDLEPRTRHMFVMHRIDLIGHREIAAHFGLSISLVEKSVRRAHGHLADQYRRQRLRKRSAGTPGGLLEAQLVPGFTMDRAA